MGNPGINEFLHPLDSANRLASLWRAFAMVIMLFCASCVWYPSWEKLHVGGQSCSAGASARKLGQCKVRGNRELYNALPHEAECTTRLMSNDKQTAIYYSVCDRWNNLRVMHNYVAMLSRQDLEDWTGPRLDGHLKWAIEAFEIDLHIRH